MNSLVTRLDDDPRSQARRLAIQFLYQLDVQNGRNLDQIDSFLAEYAQCQTSKDLALDWIVHTWKQLQTIDEMVRSVSTNWQLSRISVVDRSILRLAVYQLISCPDIPPKVVINEAVELAKYFSTAQAPNFINGILDALRKNQEQLNQPQQIG